MSDNYESHKAPENVSHISDSRIVLVTLPAHTSHKMPSLNGIVFGPL